MIIAERSYLIRYVKSENQIKLMQKIDIENSFDYLIVGEEL